MLKAYPRVIGEVETLRQVCAGASIARYGDGELKMAHHLSGIKSQAADQGLTDRLSAILSDSGDCLVGIPNIYDVIEQNPSDQKVQHWTKYLWARTVLFERSYVSAFISRPDSAPWINTPDYWALLESLWKGQDITLVRGSGKSLTVEDCASARSVTEIIAPRQHAWVEYDDVLARVLSAKPARVLIGLGPTATVLAVDLCARGIHAIDLGHVAMFLRKFRRGEVMQLTDEEKALPA